jgi:outer membrane protein OmpA-like peptidoglycan-associated protein
VAALLGAVGGAAIGGGSGYYFDQQEAALRKELVDSGVQVKRVGDNELQLIMAQGIGFETGSYNLSPSIFATLNGVANILNEYAESSLSIAGHTDSVGSDNSNLTLSERRAESVSNYLVRKNVKSGRLTTSGYGERRPVASNDNAAGRAANRRVEISIIAN